jgi:hypothetical protein
MDLSVLAKEIAKVYLQYHKKYTNKIPSFTNIEGSKWWVYFMKCAMLYGNKEEWNTYKFIEAQFDTKGDVYPYELSKSDAWEIYLEYRKRDSDLEIYVARNLLATYNYMKDWSKDNGYDVPNYKKFFNDPKQRFYIKRQSLSFYLFSILKSFYEEFYNKLSDEEKDSLIEVEELMKLRAVIYSNRKLKNKMQEVLGHEFV